MPLSEINPQYEKNDVFRAFPTHAEVCKNDISNERGEEFDLMDVQITVYSLSGMSVHPNDKLEQRKQPKDHRRKKTSLLATDETQPTEKRSIPTTAVVSFCRNIVSSGTSIETFLPSRSLITPCLGSEAPSMHNVSWHAPETSPFLDVDESDDNECTTFKITRVMQRQSYHREVSIREVTNYVPETIEFKVGVGRGKEVISLGAAFVSVTGEEEGETLINVPVKAFTPKNSNRSVFRSKTGQKKRRQRAVFASDPMWSFGLDENATLRVGVRVTPHESRKKAQSSTIRSLDAILEGMYDENMVIELDDEHLLLEQLKKSQQVPRRAHSGRKSSQVQNTLSLSSFFCGAIPGCSARDDDSTPRNAAKVRREIQMGSRKTEAVVLSLSLMSSVSESTFGSEVDSPVVDEGRTKF
jgi:hypothetical protein